MTAFLRNCINLIKGKQNDCLSSKKQPSMKRDIGIIDRNWNVHRTV